MRPSTIQVVLNTLTHVHIYTFGMYKVFKTLKTYRNNICIVSSLNSKMRKKATSLPWPGLNDSQESFVSTAQKSANIGDKLMKANVLRTSSSVSSKVGDRHF